MGAKAQTPDLQQALSGFTGTEISILSEARAAHRHAPNFLASVVALIAQPDPMLQRAGGWLLLESARDNTINPHDALDASAPHLAGVEDWQCALTLLQLADLIATPLKQPKDWARFATAHFTHKRPFLRAWAVNALCRLAAHHPEHLDAASRALTAARSDTAASVRARARNINLPANSAT